MTPKRPSRKVTVKETAIQKAILDYLALRPDCHCWRNQNIGVYDSKRRVFRVNSTTKGISDILGVHSSGKIIAIEVKSGHGKLSTDQRFFLEKIREMGGIQGVARSVEDARSILDLAAV